MILFDFCLTSFLTDIIANIPEELALHLLSFLDLQDIVACLRVSRFVVSLRLSWKILICICQNLA